jgi:hypothetical protein
MDGRVPPSADAGSAAGLGVGPDGAGLACTVDDAADAASSIALTAISPLDG